jgi:DNA-binding response OmpR family regulator
MTQKHVLVVDDDYAVRDQIHDFLSHHAFEVSTAADGAAMTRILKSRPVDLIVLDLQLAREDGFDLMRGIIAQAYAPIISVAGERSGEPDTVAALELGAEDCMTKPLGLRELVARIRTVLRRTERSERNRRERRVRYRFAGWELDMRARSLTAPGGEVVKITCAEFNLLTAFLRAPQQVLTREQLIAASRVHRDEVYDRSIDVMILRLRRKLRAAPGGSGIIRTERGAGYVLAVPVETF